MKRDRVFSLAVFVIMCTISLRSVNADPVLDLWMEFNSDTSTIEVHRTNTDFGLGGLSYNLQFSESLNLSREYSDYGWVADTTSTNEIFDNSNPIDGSTGSFTNIYFDTVRNPMGSEFGAGTTGIVESLTILDMTPRWIYIDIVSPSASNGLGDDLITIGGSLNIAPDNNPDAPEHGHTLAVQIIPEPITILLFGMGGLFVLGKRKK